MELEEMQAAWSQMSTELEQQKQLTNDIIMKMIQEKHTSLWGKYRRIETIGALVCFSAVAYILFNFSKLDTNALRICGLLMVIFLTLLPIFSLTILKGMSNINIRSRNYIQTMQDYVKHKKRFATFQKVNLGASFVFMLLTIPVSAKILNGENLFESMDEKLLYSLPLMVLLFVGLIVLITKLNRKVLTNTEKLLEEIKDVS